VQSQDPEILNTILRYKVEMNMADNLEKTPIFYAVEVGNIKAVDILLKYKAEANWIDCFGRTPVY
jgi:ankyrin repeat protein